MESVGSARENFAPSSYCPILRMRKLRPGELVEEGVPLFHSFGLANIMHSAPSCQKGNMVPRGGTQTAAY